MDESTLTFAALDARIEKLPAHPSVDAPMTGRQRWFLGFGLVGWIISVIASRVLPSDEFYTLVIIVMGFVLELLGLGVAMIWSRIRLPSFARERREYAEALDAEMEGHQALVAWLRRFPAAVLRRKHAMPCIA